MHFRMGQPGQPSGIDGAVDVAGRETVAGGHIVNDDETSNRDRLKNLVNVAHSRYPDRHREQAKRAIVEQVISGAFNDLDVEVG